MENKDYTRFSCCAYWQQCDLGRGVCVFDATEPNKKTFCGAYLNRDLRNDLQQEVKTEKVEVTEPTLFELPVAVPEPTATNQHDDLLLFELEETPSAPQPKSAKKPDFIEATGQFTLF